VTIRTGTALGRDITIAELLTQGVNGVLVAVGGWDSRLARTGGKGDVSPVPGCHLLIDAAKAGSDGYPQIQLNGHVIIVGSPYLNDALMERCKALGASEITLLVREAAPGDFRDVNVQTNLGILRLYGQGDRLQAVDLIHLDSREIRHMEADHIIFAAGRIPELIFIPAALPEGEQDSQKTIAAKDAWEAFAPYKQPDAYGQYGLLAQGDAMTDFSAAIKAIAAGRRAAASLHQGIYGISSDLPDNVVTPSTPVQNVDRVFHVPANVRQTMPLADANQLSRGSELEMGYSSESARKEAARCLQCGLICYLRTTDSGQNQQAATGT
jgi:hypothetical protein